FAISVSWIASTYGTSWAARTPTRTFVINDSPQGSIALPRIPSSTNDGYSGACHRSRARSTSALLVNRSHVPYRTLYPSDNVTGSNTRRKSHPRSPRWAQPWLITPARAQTYWSGC